MIDGSAARSSSPIPGTGMRFLPLYKADRAATPMTALPLSLRLGGLKPDWRTPPASDAGRPWGNMQVPGSWGTRGLPDFDGVVWFTRTFTWSAGSPDATIALGRIGNPERKCGSTD